MGVAFLVVLFAFNANWISQIIHPTKYIASDQEVISLSLAYEKKGEAFHKKVDIPRGAAVRVRQANDTSSEVEYQNKHFNLPNEYLVDHKNQVVLTKQVYAKRSMNLYRSANHLAKVMIPLGHKMKVVGYRHLKENGQVDYYKVRYQNKDYLVAGQDVQPQAQVALLKAPYSVFWDQFYGDGYSKKAYTNGLDATMYPPKEAKKDVKGFHLSLKNFMEHADIYTKQSQLNTYIVELKDDRGFVRIGSDYSIDQIQAMVKKYHQAGYYLIGRQVVFKDSQYAQTHPEVAIVHASGKPATINGEKWPSPYSRQVWQYNYEVARKIAKAGFDEIQFDYCRFPDGLADQQKLNLRNQYHESKVAAIQGFLLYMRNQFINQKVVIGADVFAWPLVAQDDQDIGQYYPALIGTVDVLSPMAYLDLFAPGSLNVEQPVNQPRQMMSLYGESMTNLQRRMKAKSLMRPWIQGYEPIDASSLADQLAGLEQQGIHQYMIWTSEGDPAYLDYLFKED